MEELLKSPQAIAAVVAAITSLATLLLTLLTKNFIEKRLLLFKLDTEHKFEQRKKIKAVLAVNKSHLLTACETLNHRLLNFSNPDNFEWLDVKGNYEEPHYYFHSFVYRILAAYAWMHKIESELIHLDTTIATKDDLELIKFMRFYRRIFADTSFFKDLPYNYDTQRDHIFKNNLNDLHLCVMNGSTVISFNEYLKNNRNLYKGQLLVFYKLLDGVNPSEKRFRWEWFQILKMLNLAFLNSYGYDYQQTSDKKMLIAINSPRKSILNDNFIFLLSEHKLDNQKQVKRLIKLLRME
jgi:hypothetical protein